MVAIRSHNLRLVERGTSLGSIDCDRLVEMRATRAVAASSIFCIVERRRMVLTSNRLLDWWTVRRTMGILKKKGYSEGNEARNNKSYDNQNGLQEVMQMKCLMKC